MGMHHVIDAKKTGFVALEDKQRLHHQQEKRKNTHTERITATWNMIYKNYCKFSNLLS